MYLRPGFRSWALGLGLFSRTTSGSVMACRMSSLVIPALASRSDLAPCTRAEASRSTISPCGPRRSSPLSGWELFFVTAWHVKGARNVDGPLFLLVIRDHLTEHLVQCLEHRPRHLDEVRCKVFHTTIYWNELLNPDNTVPAKGSHAETRWPDRLRLGGNWGGDPPFAGWRSGLLFCFSIVGAWQVLILAHDDGAYHRDLRGARSRSQHLELAKASSCSRVPDHTLRSALPSMPGHRPVPEYCQKLQPSRCQLVGTIGRSTP